MRIPSSKRLPDLFVVERVAGRIDHPLAVGDGDAAPLVEQLADAGLAALGGGGRTLVADGAGMVQEFVGDPALLVVPGGAHRVRASFGA